MHIRRLFLLLILFLPLVLPGTVIAQSFDVSLVEDSPVYTVRDAGYGIWRHNVKDAFGGIEVVTDAGGSSRFVLSGYCAMPGAPPGVSSEDTSFMTDVWNSRGMYLLNENGGEIGTRDVCFDAALVASICKHDTGCHFNTRTFNTGGTQFVRLGSVSANTPTRSPIVYDALSSGFQMLSKIYFNDFDGNFQGGKREPRIGDRRDHAYAAYANGVLITWQSVFEENVPFLSCTGSPRQRFNQDGFLSSVNSYYSVPELSRLGDESDVVPPWNISGIQCSGRARQAPGTKAKYFPVVGIGEYFIHWDLEASGAVPPLKVYKMPSRQQISGGARPTLAQNQNLPVGPGFPHGFKNAFHGYSVDAFNENRVALFFDSGEGGLDVRVYEPGSNGIVQVAEYLNRPIRKTHFNPRTRGSVGTIAGAYLAYANPSGDLVVEKNGVPLSVEPLPPSGGWINPLSNVEIDVGGKIGASNLIAITPNGRILTGASADVSQDRFNTRAFAQGSSNYLYLFQINELDPGGGGGGGGNGDPTFPDITPPDVPALSFDIQFYFDLATSYLNQLRSIIGGTTGVDGPTQGTGFDEQNNFFTPRNNLQNFESRLNDIEERIQRIRGF